MIVEVPRRWRWVIGGLALLSMIEMVALWRAGSAIDAVEAPTNVSIDVPVGVNGDTAGPFVAPGGAPPAAAAAEEVEICGGGWARVPSETLTDVRAWLHLDNVQQARLSLLDKLRATGGDFGRTAATWFALRGLDAPAPGEPAFDAARDAVAQAATTSNDPKVYALAFGLCQLRETSATPITGACQLIDARQWARLDPQNASPWMYILSDAAQRKDRATQDEALFRIASAQRSETYSMALPGVIANADGAEPATTVAAMAMATDAMSVATSLSFPGYQALVAACRGNELKDANRRQNCEAVTTLMTERSDSIMERLIGTRMSIALGAPEARLDEVRGAYYAFATNYNLGVLTSEGAALDCDSMHRNLRRLTQLATVGEAQTAREWARQSGKSPAAFGEEYRAQQEALRVAAQSAATASAVASRTE